jgi:membrane-bound lytic murein transglycosylase B
MNSTFLCRLSCCQAVTRFLAIVAFSFVWMLGYTDCAFGEPLTVPHPFAALKTQLVRDGFDETLIQSLYSRPEVTFNQRGISAYFSHREATLDYGQFLTPRSINEAIDYLGRNQKALKRAQSAYGVKGEIITAIILVETRLGTFIGKRLVLNTLSTLAALGDKDTRDGVWHAYLKNKADRSKQQFESWASKKSAWAYGELKSYLTYTKAQGIDPSSMRGSFAGALGIAQFLPSSVLKFGKDGNRDGRINLFDHEDAIESIASYLNQHGWRPSLTRNEAFRVILYYNNSKYYAETILKVSERLAKSRP